MADTPAPETSSPTGSTAITQRWPSRRTNCAILAIAILTVLAVVLSNERTFSLLLTTAQLSISVAAISVPVGTLLAVLLARTDLPLRHSISLLLAVQLLLPLYLVTAAWQSAFGLQGSFTIWLDSSRPLLDGAVGAIWVHSMAAIPWVTLIVGTGLRLVEPELEEDALTVAPASRVLWRVTLPRTSGAIGVAILWIVVTTGSEMTATDLFQMRTLAEEVYTAFAATSDTTAASLQLVPGMIITVVLVTMALIGCAAYLPQTLRRRPRAPITFPLSRTRWPWFAVVITILLIIAVIPLASLAYRTGFETVQSGDLPTRSWSVAKLANMITLQAFDGSGGVLFGREIVTSLVVGAISAGLAISLGTWLAWRAQRGRASLLIMFLAVAACMAIPGPLIGKSIIWSLSYVPAIYDSVFAPALAQAVRAIPLATLIMWYALSSIDRHVLESARLDGTNPSGQLLDVALPMRRMPLAVAFVVAMIVSIGDLTASQLVMVPGSETLANRVFDRLHSGAYDQVSAVCLALIIATCGITVILASLWKKSDKTG